MQYVRKNTLLAAKGLNPLKSATALYLSCISTISSLHIFPAYLLYLPCISTISSLHIHYIFPAYIYYIFPAYPLYLPCIYLPYLPCISTISSLHIHYIFPAYIYYIFPAYHYIFPAYPLYLPYISTISSLHIHYIFPAITISSLDIYHIFPAYHYIFPAYLPYLPCTSTISSCISTISSLHIHYICNNQTHMTHNTCPTLLQLRWWNVIQMDTYLSTSADNLIRCIYKAIYLNSICNLIPPLVSSPDTSLINPHCVILCNQDFLSMHKRVAAGLACTLHCRLRPFHMNHASRIFIFSSSSDRTWHHSFQYINGTHCHSNRNFILWSWATRRSWEAISNKL